VNAQEQKAYNKRLDRIAKAVEENNVLLRTLIMVETAHLPSQQADAVLRALGIVK